MVGSPVPEQRKLFKKSFVADPLLTDPKMTSLQNSQIAVLLFDRLAQHTLFVKIPDLIKAEPLFNEEGCSLSTQKK
jgi:hypothetical protein